MQIPHIVDFNRVVFFTGAGMSAESGVPTYRGKGGIWREYDHERYACQRAFERDPEGVWEFHNFRRGLVQACHPHGGHRLIVAAQRANPEGTTVVTQNIDGMHQLAGSTGVRELHGSLWRVRCEACGLQHEGREAPLRTLRCGCGSWWRPDITWFGDMLNDPVVAEATLAIKRCDLLISIGTSAVVYPAARLPELAKARGAVLVEINPEPTPVSGWYDHHLRGPASEMLAQMGRGLSLD
jgi:NAD-dependent deacetylase